MDRLPRNVTGDTRPRFVLWIDDAIGSSMHDVYEDAALEGWGAPFAELGGLTPLAYCKALRLPITWAIASANTEAGSNGDAIPGAGSGYASMGRLTWDELIDYVNTCGGELASHSVTHTAGGSVVDFYKAELADSKAAIEAATGFTVKHFVEPGAWTLTSVAHLGTVGVETDAQAWAKLNSEVYSYMQTLYESSRAYLPGMTSAKAFPLAYRYGTHYGLDLGGASITEAKALNLLKSASCSQGMCFSCYSHIPAPENGSEAVAISIFKAFIDALASYRDQGLLVIASASEAFEFARGQRLNLSPDPNFSGGSFWTFYSTAFARNSYAEHYRLDGAAISTSWISGQIVLNPGRYTLSWEQKQHTVYTDANHVNVYISNSSPAVNSKVENAGTDWESHTLGFTAKTHLPTQILLSQLTEGGGAYIRNMQIIPVGNAARTAAVREAAGTRQARP